MSGSNLNVSSEWLDGLRSHIYTTSTKYRNVQDRRGSRITVINAYNGANVLHEAKEFVNRTLTGVGPRSSECFAKRAISFLVQRGSIEVLEPGERIRWKSDCYLIVRSPRNVDTRSTNQLLKSCANTE